MNAFKRINVCPLLPPQFDDTAVANHAFTAAMQCGEGKKAVELESVTRRVLKPVAFSSSDTQEKITILKPKEDISRNLLIRSLAYEILNKTLLVPSQKINRIQQEHQVAKEKKVGRLLFLRSNASRPLTRSVVYM